MNVYDYDRLKVRIWRRCQWCGKLVHSFIIAGNSIVQNLIWSTLTCDSPVDDAHPYCQMRQEGNYEQCTGFMDSDETLVFAGDRVGTDDVNWAEVEWQSERGQWYAGGIPLWLELSHGAKVVGNSHDRDQEGRKPNE